MLPSTSEEYEIIRLSKEREKNCFLNISESEIRIWNGKNGNQKKSFPLKSDVKILINYDKERFEEIKSVSLIDEDQNFKFTHKNPNVLRQIISSLKKRAFFLLLDTSFQIKEILWNELSGPVIGAVERNTGMLLAIKMIVKENNRILKDQAKIRKQLNLLRRANHENLIKIDAIYENYEYFCISMEMIKGCNLKECINKKGHLSSSECALIFEVLLNVLEYLHSIEIIHRDIKPENIIIRSSIISRENIYLVGFDHAVFKKDIPFSVLYGGSPGYIAPELFSSVKSMFENDNLYDERCDYFSLGITIYYAIFGKLPYKSQEISDLLNLNKKCKFQFEKNEKFKFFKKDLLAFLENKPQKRRTADKKLNSIFLFNLFTYDDEDFDEANGNPVTEKISSLKIIEQKRRFSSD